MSILFERVGRTLIFSVNTRLKTPIGLLQFNQVVVANEPKNLLQNATNVLLNGKKIFVKTTNRINAKTTIVRESWRPPIRGLRNGVFKFTRLNDNVTQVTGIIDGKRIRPYLIICSSQGCKSPDQLFFQNGTPVQLKINPRLLRAMQFLLLKARNEVDAFLKRQNIQKKIRLSQGSCFVCDARYALCTGGCPLPFFFIDGRCAEACENDYKKCKAENHCS